MKGARMVWPKEKDLEVREEGSRTQVILENSSRYTAMLLSI